MGDEEDFEFIERASLHPWEARYILPRLIEESIRFEIATDDVSIRQMNPVTARYGGTWGNGSLIRLFVHHEDNKELAAILKERWPE